ncbi:MAG: tRNA uracil 4-sulfurtransferase ThiI [Bdellovibrionota bacterium]
MQPDADYAVLLRYHEIALKGDNRSWFEDKLAANVLRQLRREAPGIVIPGMRPEDIEKVGGTGWMLKVERLQGRMVISLPSVLRGEVTLEERARVSSAVLEACSRTFGLQSYGLGRIVESQMPLVQAAAIAEFRAAMAEYERAEGKPVRSFCVRTRRSDKILGESSMDVDFHVGGAIGQACGPLVVDIANPDLQLHVEVRKGNSFVWSRKSLGLGGMPGGTNGRFLAIISGGFDSPIAAIQLLKRGGIVGFVHFYGTPFVGEATLRKIEDLVRLVNRYQPVPQPLLVVPFGKIQEKIALVTQPEIRTLLYRRMMFRIACRLSDMTGGIGIVTGESLGQVASQTVENLVAIDSSASRPVFRPLITFDKQEIINLAKRFGTFEKSAEPGVDCCTLFADRRPVTRASDAQAREQESLFDVDALVAEALEQTEIRKPGRPLRMLKDSRYQANDRSTEV